MDRSVFRRIAAVIAAALLSTILYAEVINGSQRLKADHPVYEAMNRLQMEAGIAGFTDNAPLSVTEILFFLEDIDPESLSPSGRNLYEQVKSYLTTKDAIIVDGSFSADAGLEVTLEAYEKTNEQIPWDFMYNYDGPLLMTPIKFGFDEYITLETDLFLEKNYFAVQNAANHSNIPLDVNDVRFLFPDYAYGSFATRFNDWGVSFQIGKQGRQIGHTETASIVYDSSFETDMYSTLSLYSRNFRYSLDVSQVSWNQFLYMHEVEGRPFKNLKLTYVQASMINGTFSLRQINPMMVAHSFMGNYENVSELERTYYNESTVCAYLCLMFDYAPISNLRLYGAFAQTEMQAPNEKGDDLYSCLPNGIGGQLGASYLIPAADDSSWKLATEAVYTSPYLYIKQTPGTSLCRLRYFNEIPSLNPSVPVCTWIGSPFGPDCFASYNSVTYTKNGSWSVKLSYLFKVHGDNYADMLYYDEHDQSSVPNTTEVTLADGSKQNVYNYYPFAKYQLATTDAERAAALAESQNLWMSGIQEYTHQVSIEGSVNLTEQLSCSALAAWDIIFNCGNKAGNTQHGLEAALSVKYVF